jgi:hypothetical protein
MYNFAACSIQSSFELNASPLPYGLSSVAFKHWRYTATYTGDKAAGLNAKYASDANWGKKVAGHMSHLNQQLYHLYMLLYNANVLDLNILHSCIILLHLLWNKRSCKRQK